MLSNDISSSNIITNKNLLHVALFVATCFSLSRGCIPLSWFGVYPIWITYILITQRINATSTKNTKHENNDCDDDKVQHNNKHVKVGNETHLYIDTVQLLKIWISFSLCLIAETFLDAVLYSLWGFHFLKYAFVTYTFNQNTNGADYIYTFAIEPFLNSHREQFEYYKDKFSSRLEDFQKMKTI